MVNITRNIVNGKLLNQFNNKPVSIIGIVTNINPNGTHFDIRTTDDMTVTINLSSPLDDMVDGYVEVHGTSRGNSVTAEEFIQFTPQQSNDFDIQGHDQLCHLLNSLPDVYKIHDN